MTVSHLPREHATLSGRTIVHIRTILAVALAMRVFAAVLLCMLHSPAVQVRSHTEVFAIAISLVQGHGFSSPFFAPSGPTAFLAPGYPFLVAAVFRLFGIGSGAFVAMVAIQIVFSVLTVWIAICVAEEHFGATTANIAGTICALSLPLAAAPFIVWETCLSSLLLLAFLMAVPRLRTQAQWAAAGAGTAIAALVNPSLIPTLFCLEAWQARRIRKIPWIGLLGFLLVYAPWPARNLAVMHAWIPLRTDVGYELWMGNHSGGDGNFNQQLNPEVNPEERASFVSLGELGFMRMKTASSVDYIRTHPGDFLNWTIRRIGRFWTAATHGMIVTGTIFSCLALAGFVLLLRNRPDLRILYAIPLLIYPLPYYITHPDARFRYVIDPVLAILMAYAISVFYARVTAGRQRTVAVSETG